MTKRTYTLQELAKFLAAEFWGDPNCLITGIGSLDKATPSQISFLKSHHYSKYLATTKAAAVIARPEHAEQNSGNWIIVNDPYLAYAKISGFFDDAPIISPGIHATALIGEDCEIGAGTSIGPYCVIGHRVKIGENAQIAAGSVISDDVVIGEKTKLCANVVLYHRVKIGKRCLLHSGAVIGSDGFGNANEKGVWHKIYQLGTVIIGNDVEIGANTTVDRGAISDTIIEDGVKLDNQIQVGHNVHIGAHTAIAGCTGIAGSTKIGRYCMIGGGVGITGHIEITDGVIISGKSAIGKSITKPGMYASSIPAMPYRTWGRVLVRLAKLGENKKT
ncbi:UDP-3-O-(3-hydroxymyristoyl)glucosamine N-acyltransferase [Gammaproteobacteria bacterium]